MASETDDDHPGIPHDADGNPIFLILPPDMQAEYDRKLEMCRAGWQATDDPAAPMEALVLAYCYRQPPQFWFVEAACMVMSKRRTKRYMTRRYNATIKWMRYEQVRHAVREEGLHWPQAYRRAAERLAKTTAKAEWPSMKADYDEVARDIKQGRGALYVFMPKTPNFARYKARLGEGSKRKPSPR